MSHTEHTDPCTVYPPIADHDDLVALTSYMARSGDYTASDIAYAVEKPWKFTDVLYHAGHASNVGGKHTFRDGCPDAAS
ncbi:MAG: hypothetical protein LC798_10950 [Chloroflexi bacterium]|nr:hypothetical protein [Chloroflexota bacterium]